VARNQVARNLQTKLALVQGSSKPATPDPASSKKSSTEYLQEYCKHYGINPFKQKEGKKYLNIMSHNRRRWSHVFPVGKAFLYLQSSRREVMTFVQANPPPWTTDSTGRV